MKGKCLVKEFIEVHTWDDHCAPWMVRVKSITKVARGDHNRAIIYINDSMKMECVETYDSLKEIFMKEKKKKVDNYPVVVSQVEIEEDDNED